LETKINQIMGKFNLIQSYKASELMDS